MPVFQLILIALIQGVTEFLPVSSSAHLILLPKLTGLQDQGIAIDVAVHLGTLFAVLLYLLKDIKVLLKGLLETLGFQHRSAAFSLLLCLVTATIPVIIFGFLMNLGEIDNNLRSVKVIAWTMLIFGIVLYYSDQKGAATRTVDNWTIKSALTMGFWQTLALIPGTSRAGAVISGARLLDFSRQDSAKIAMLMSIPTILASGVLLSAEIISSGDTNLVKDFIIATILSFIAALLSIRFMMYFLVRYSYTPYVIYRIVFGLVLLSVAYS